VKHCLILLLLLLLVSGEVSAFGNKNKRGLPRTEAGLMSNLLGCLSHRDTQAYFNLFVPFDTLWQLTLHNPDRSPEAMQELTHLKEHPQALIEFDPKFNGNIIGRFVNVLKKGEDSGLHWDAITMQRYELRRQGITNSSMLGYDKIAPERFKGYLFVKDLLGRTTWCITVKEIQKINGYFFGGQVLNMLQASTIDEYIKKEADEDRYMQWMAAHPYADSAQIDSLKNGGVRKKDSLGKKEPPVADDDENTTTRRQVVDRKYYEGMFDETIPVKLYVRYMKEMVGNKPIMFDGLYKFGDQKSYVRLDITRDGTSKWIMEDNIPLGTLELILRDRVYTGTWTNADDNGYEVKLTQTGVPPKKVEAMDNILDKGLSGRIDEASYSENPEEDKDKAKEKDEEKEKDPKEKDEKSEDEKAKKKREDTEKARTKEEQFIDKAQKKAEKEKAKSERRERRRLERMKEANE
jgi:hypothetical protein